MDILKTLAGELGRSLEHVTNVVNLIDEGATIPFIARYRKEMHGAMDDTTLRALETRLQYLRNLAQRKEEIIHSRMISEFLCDLTESVYDKTITYKNFSQLATQYTSDTYTKAINKNITNLPPDLNLLNKFFQKGNIRILWYLCHLRKFFLSLL